MRRWYVWILLGLVLLAACGQPPSTVTYQQPSRDAIRAMVYQEGDLPEGFISGLEDNTAPPFYLRELIPGSPVELMISLGEPPLDGPGLGVIIASWFPTEALTLDVYEKLADGGSTSRIKPPIGEESVWFDNGLLGIAGVVFKRCGVVIYFHMPIQPYYPYLPFTRETTIEHARRIDARLQNDICPITQAPATPTP